MLKNYFLILLLILSTCASEAQNKQDTLKGSVTPERVWWNVLHYALTVKPDYIKQTITGENTIEYRVVQNRHTPFMQIDLQSPLTIDSVKFNNRRLSYRQDGNAWMIKTPPTNNKGVQKITIYYSGKPKVSVNAPWDGGLVWSRDSLGRPWMAVACQLVGASVWYPCKVYLGDKPDRGASMRIIVPDTLVAVSNGLQKGIHHNADGTSTYSWAVTSPINNYGITFYIGKYVNTPDAFPGEKGKLNMDFWVLDYNVPKVKSYLIPEVHKTVRSLEHWFGPYPFCQDGFKMVEAPYIGMEHQSAIGYGNQFRNGRYGAKRLTYWDMKTDRMIVHETAHEWFGNNITAKDPADRWVQEGFAGYAEELIMEDFYGSKAGNEFFMNRSTGRIGNAAPIISRYGIFEDAGEDMYMKGWVLLHMVRAIVNDDEKFRKLLRDLNTHFYHQTVTTKDIENFMSKASGKDLSKVFDQYLRTTQIPVFEYKLSANKLTYRFTNSIAKFEIPIKTNLTGKDWLYASSSWKTILIKRGPADTLSVDPNFYVGIKKVD
ncbi:MAG: peptidase family rane alanine aminopeptidase [Mucilaginibacter sp.]|nr:peptidase family rane alanine aminopeptidase [Mucilaginibacter sp.]